MNILVTGGSGKLGKHLIPLLRGRHYITAPSHKDFDITRDKITEFHGIHAVVHLAGYTDVVNIENHPEKAEVNMEIDWLNGFTGKVFFLSTDYVYSGYERDSKETDMMAPFNIYGYSKAAADILLDMRATLGRYGSLVTIRTSFKPSKWPHSVAFDDMYTNADYVDVIADMIAEFICLDPPAGVWNIGTERKTVYELVKRRNPNVQPGSVKSVPYLRPEVTMDLSKYHQFLRGMK